MDLAALNFQLVLSWCAFALTVLLVNQDDFLKDYAAILNEYLSFILLDKDRSKPVALTNREIELDIKHMNHKLQ